MTGSTRTISGEVVQVLEPGEKSAYAIPSPIRAMAEGRTIVVLWTEEPPTWRRWIAEAPVVVETFLGPLANLVEPIEWENVVVPNDLEVEVGDRLEVEADPSTVRSVWTAGQCSAVEVVQRAELIPPGEGGS